MVLGSRGSQCRAQRATETSALWIWLMLASGGRRGQANALRPRLVRIE